MTIQRVIQISLIIMLVWQIWFFHIRMGVEWGEKRKKKANETGKGDEEEEKVQKAI